MRIASKEALVRNSHFGSSILVTGCIGFIGSHLCDVLLDSGHQVIGLDDESTGSRFLLDRWHDHPRFQYLQADVREPISLTNVSHIYHLACPASPKQYQRDPVRTLTTNVIGTLQVLSLARQNQSRVLLTSTSEIYGDPEQHPQTEVYCGNVDPLGIRACYDEGKRCAETLCMDYHRQYGVEIKIARLFNTYGPRMRQDDGRVVSNFLTQALRNEDITLYGSGQQTRSFCFIDDMIIGIVRLMESSPGLLGPINLGTPEEVTMLELAECIRSLCHSKSQFTYRELPSGDPCRRRPDISLARKHLNWKPTTTLNEGIVKSIPWFREAIRLSVNPADQGSMYAPGR